PHSFAAPATRSAASVRGAVAPRPSRLPPPRSRPTTARGTPPAPPDRRMNIFWFLPPHGDGRYLGTAHGARAVSLAYLRQIAQAADELGFAGVPLPTGRSCEDAWVVASAMAALTDRLRFLVAIRPGIVSPTLAARMAATF